MNLSPQRHGWIVAVQVVWLEGSPRSPSSGMMNGGSEEEPTVDMSSRSRLRFAVVPLCVGGAREGGVAASQ